MKISHFKSQTMCRLGKKNQVKLLTYCRQRLLGEDVFQTIIIVVSLRSGFVANTVGMEKIRWDFLESNDGWKRRVASFRSVRGSTNEPAPGKLMPSSFHGSVTERKNDTEDALTTFNRRGKPHLVITVTTNPDWLEIQSTFKEPNQQTHGRPDLCC